MVSHVVEDEVVALPTLGEVLVRVVDDMVCTDGEDHVHVLRPADTGDRGAVGLGDLHRERSNASRGTIDQDLLARLDLCLIAKKRQGSDCGHTDCCGLLEGEIGRLEQEVVLACRCVLGKGSRAPAEYLITRSEVCDAAAPRLDRTRDIASCATAL